MLGVIVYSLKIIHISALLQLAVMRVCQLHNELWMPQKKLFGRTTALFKMLMLRSVHLLHQQFHCQSRRHALATLQQQYPACWLNGKKIWINISFFFLFDVFRNTGKSAILHPIQRRNLFYRCRTHKAIYSWKYMYWGATCDTVLRARANSS